MSEDFLNLTVYASGVVLGQNCWFLQGTGTDPVKVTEIGASVV